jgi:hypothetical protein
MGALRGGASKGAANPAAKPPGGAGPRGPNEVVPGGANNAGKSSPMDMLGNVANVAGLATMVPGLMPGGGDKPPADGKPKSHYEPVDR